MNIRTIVFALILLPAASLFAKETLTECLSKCPKGADACTKCCKQQDAEVNGAKIAECKKSCDLCEQRCQEDKPRCVEAADRRCDRNNKNANDALKCKAAEFDKCAAKEKTCLSQCAAQSCRENCEARRDPIPGNCAGQRPPE